MIVIPRLGVRKGTVFYRTHIELQKWFLAHRDHGERKEKPQQPPDGARLESESEIGVVYDASHTCGDGTQ